MTTPSKFTSTKKVKPFEENTFNYTAEKQLKQEVSDSLLEQQDFNEQIEQLQAEPTTSYSVDRFNNNFNLPVKQNNYLQKGYRNSLTTAKVNDAIIPRLS